MVFDELTKGGSFDRAMNFAGFGVNACPRAKSDFLMILFVDELDFRFARTILSPP
jgi:hypothetical protein